MRQRILAISVHPDDAVASCGGNLHERVATGDQVTVATVVTGDLPDGTSYSDYAKQKHLEWEAGSRPFETRRDEDKRALAHLGISSVIHLDYLDAIYRQNTNGEWLYPERKRIIGGTLHPADKALLPELTNRLTLLFTAFDVIMVPLALGGHVDHQLVRLAADRSRAGDKIQYFEDQPYRDRNKYSRIADAERRWAATSHHLQFSSVQRQFEACAIYRSQRRSLFGDKEQFPQLEDYVRRHRVFTLWRRT